MNWKNWLSGLFLFCFFAPCFSTENDGYEIAVEIKGYTEETLMLGYYYGDKQYIMDTTTITSNGKFVFADTSEIDPGIYLIIMKPDNEFLQIVINEGETNLDVYTELDDLIGKFRVKGSGDNDILYTYHRFLKGKREEASIIDEQLKEDLSDSEEKKLNKKREEIDQEVKLYQEKLIKEYPNSVTAAMIKSGIEPEVPEYSGSEEEVQLKKYRYYKNHFFDNVNLKDERLIRSWILTQKIDFYIDKLTMQHPDSINTEIDGILEELRPAEENFKYFLIHFLNKFAKSKIVGMDAVYVHIAEKYYAAGEAPWTDKEQLAKIVKNAKTLKPLLVGKITPDLMLQRKDQSPINLHSIESPFTVLFFWDPDCGHCKKSMPELVKFYEEYHPKGVEIVAVCTKMKDDLPECWKFIDSHGMNIWMNLVDPLMRSRYKVIYDIKTTPQVYVLDKDKKILSKKIGAEQLKEVLDHYLESKP